MSKQHTISIFGLVMINVIAIDSLRTLPLSAVYGFTSVTYYVLAAIFFFVPTALVAAELATGWPETGGVYVWVREAFGNRMGFLTIWLQWFYNICWYPTIMSLIAATLAYLVDPQLVQNKTYMLTVIMVVYWGATIVNAYGMRASSFLSNVTAIIGTLLPMVFVAVLGLAWWFGGHPLQNTFAWRDLVPHFDHVPHLVMLTAVLYGFVGIEMSASHAREVKNPQRDYPKATLFATILILLTMICGTLAIVAVVPVQELNIVAGLLEAFSRFFAAFHMQWMMPILAIMIALGALGGAAAWMLGPSKGMLMACRDGSLPAGLGKLSKRHAPVRILLVQGVMFTILCSAFVLLPTVSSGFWALTDVSSILSLVVYLAMFSAAIYLRYKYPNVKRAFRVPGGMVGMWVVCLCGFLSSLFAIGLGFFPPEQVPVGSPAVYETIIVTGVILGVLLPLLIYYGHRYFKK